MTAYIPNDSPFGPAKAKAPAKPATNGKSNGKAAADAAKAAVKTEAAVKRAANPAVTWRQGQGRDGRRDARRQREVSKPAGASVSKPSTVKVPA